MAFGRLSDLCSLGQHHQALLFLFNSQSRRWLGKTQQKWQCGAGRHLSKYCADAPLPLQYLFRCARYDSVHHVECRYTFEMTLSCFFVSVIHTNRKMAVMSGDVDDFHYRFKLLYPIEAKQVHAAARSNQRDSEINQRCDQSLSEPSRTNTSISAGA